MERKGRWCTIIYLMIMYLLFIYGWVVWNERGERDGVYLDEATGRELWGLLAMDVVVGWAFSWWEGEVWVYELCLHVGIIWLPAPAVRFRLWAA